MPILFRYTRYDGEASKNLQNALTVDLGINSTYEHSHIPKIISSSIKICESCCPLLVQISSASRPEFLNCYMCRSNHLR